MTVTACVRSAWLTLGTLTVALEDATAGYFCTELNLGYPTVREVMANRPDANGADDRTQYFGARTVSANIIALAGAGAQVDAVASMFAPFMVPSARPVLHYILDRPGAAERVMTLRAAGYSWPVAGPFERDIQLQWVCADPDAKDPVTRTATAWAGSSTSPGRLYNRVYPLVYPVGGNAPTTGVITPYGDLPVRPKFQIWGPVTAPALTLSPAGAGQPAATTIKFLPAFIVNAGHYVEVDAYAKTAVMDGDPQQSVVALLDWQRSTWPVINPVPPAAAGMSMQLAGGSTSVVTQVVALWQDRYLT